MTKEEIELNIRSLEYALSKTHINHPMYGEHTLHMEIKNILDKLKEQLENCK